MEPELQTIIESLTQKPPRSKLEPHRELIRELRRKGRTYREVAKLFNERLGLYVAPSTLHSFVKVRAKHTNIHNLNCHLRSPKLDLIRSLRSAQSPLPQNRNLPGLSSGKTSR